MQIKRFEFNPIAENTYVVYDQTKEAVVIDCGVYTNREKELFNRFIQENGLTIKHSLFTHLHLDHIFGLAFIYDTFGLSPEYNKKEEIIPTLAQQAGFFGMNVEDRVIPAGKYLQEGDSVLFGDSEFKTIEVPGHSPGSICFYSAAHACLFSGDVVFRGSIGRTDLWAGDYDQLITGIKDKILILPEETAVYPGHGLVTTVRYEKNSNPFLQ